MSSLEELEKEGLLSKRQLKALKIRARARATQLKRLRTIQDKIARQVFQNYINNGRSWKGIEDKRALFRKLMSNRHKLHERIARLVPEPVEPEWDSP